MLMAVWILEIPRLAVNIVLLIDRFYVVLFSDVILQELISLFTQELWMEKPIPHQFLSFILSHSDSGCPVVDSLIQELGGTKVITKWTQKQTVWRLLFATAWQCEV